MRFLSLVQSPLEDEPQHQFFFSNFVKTKKNLQKKVNLRSQTKDIRLFFFLLHFLEH
jgi:hypothetical protein